MVLNQMIFDKSVSLLGKSVEFDSIHHKLQLRLHRNWYWLNVVFNILQCKYVVVNLCNQHMLTFALLARQCQHTLVHSTNVNNSPLESLNMFYGCHPAGLVLRIANLVYALCVLHIVRNKMEILHKSSIHLGFYCTKAAEFERTRRVSSNWAARVQ